MGKIKNLDIMSKHERFHEPPMSPQNRVVPHASSLQPCDKPCIQPTVSACSNGHIQPSVITIETLHE